MKLTEIIKYVVDNPKSAFFYTPPIYPDSKSYFFTEIETEIIHHSEEKVSSCLNQIDILLEKGLTAFGYINYEFGYLLEQRLRKFLPEQKDNPLLHFLFCNENSIKKFYSGELDYTDVEDHIGRQIVVDFTLGTSKDEYINNVKKIKNYIADGDTYQVNYTVKSKFNFTGSIMDIFFQLIFSQSAQYSALINLGDKFILSSSPELFFEIANDTIKVKPMKGTIKRGKNFFEDEQRGKELLESEKDRAENIMIVDLLRNDIGKICNYGSVRLLKKYNIERYESVYQLTSDVEGNLNSNKISDVILNLFPSGSITGAPKLRTMEIINELEKESRGVYTGLIGMFSKNYSVANVAIRTLEIDEKMQFGTLGIGSGIVWDSEPEKEYDEVILKSKFLTDPPIYFELLESMLYENGEIFLLDYHLKRLKDTAEYFLFMFDEELIQNKLTATTAPLEKNKKYKIKLTLSKWGRVSISDEIIEKNNNPINVILSGTRIDSQNRFQYFKTTNRKLYDSELKKYRADGYSEVLFLNERENVAEGAISNLLIHSGNKLITPPIDDGILDGCYRQYMLSKLPILEGSITFEQLINSEKVILINSVRKESVVSKIYDSTGKLLREFNL